MENTFQSGFGPVSHFPDSNYWHYTLQLNLYRWLLEKHYGIVVSEMALVIMHPNNANYKRYKLNRLDEEIEGVIEARRAAVARGKGEVAYFSVSDMADEDDHDTSFKGPAFV